ncbi:helix-turn-helix domain-containing protein [Lichenihabitans psoromatis]|uniref:helix-turn-helix domain-containing protein n=1 Tax=Lichenihabitans psoromatis TaxID=2528642 RepID=UPI0013F168DD|nr:helix-turn-helix domain-containing protein [Lichenihabitans psoromatis]
MAKVKLDLANRPTFSRETLVRLDAMTAEEVEQNAHEDVDNPPMTEEELDIVRLARRVQSIRKARGMSQSVFARTYHFSAARLKDWEQGRRRPDPAALAYLETIRVEPEAVERALSHMESSAA